MYLYPTAGITLHETIIFSKLLRCQKAFIVFLSLVYSDGMPSTAIGDIYIPDVNDGSKLKVKFASGKFLQSHSMQNIANILKISKPVLISFNFKP